MRLRLDKQLQQLSALVSSSVQTSIKNLGAKMSSLLSSTLESDNWKAKLHRLLYRTILQNINIFSWKFDDVKDNSSLKVMQKFNRVQQTQQSSKVPGLTVNTQFLFPFSIIFFTLSHCVVMLLSGRPDCLLTHQIFPREIWPQSDIIFSIGGSMSLLIYSCLLFGVENRRAVNRAEMHLHFGPDQRLLSGPRRVLKSSVGRSILVFRARARLATHLMLLQLILYAELYFTYQMLFAHRLPLRQVLFLTFYFPFYTTYCIFSNIGLFAYFFIASQYLKIKVKELLLRPMRAALVSCAGHHKCHKVSALWRKFGSFNQQTVHLNRELHAVNQFWGLYVTIYFVGYILLISYLAYCFLFARFTSFFARSFFMFFGVNNFLLLYLVIYHCTGLLRQNRAVQGLNLQLCRLLKNSGTFKLTEANLIKTQSIIFNQYVNVGFRLNNGHLISSNTYIQTFHAMSTYFMLTFIGKI